MEVKYARNRNLPSVEKIGLDGETIYIALSRQADSIKVTGQDHTTLSLARNSSAASYTMRDNDPYARITAYFPDGEVIYTNPFARYDASVAQTPSDGSGAYGKHPVDDSFQLYASCPVRGSDPYIL